MVYWRKLYTCLYMWQVCLSMTPGRGIEMLMTIRSRFLAGLKSASKIESDLVKGQAKGSWRTKRVSNSFEDWMVWDQRGNIWDRFCCWEISKLDWWLWMLEGSLRLCSMDFNHCASAFICTRIKYAIQWLTCHSLVMKILNRQWSDNKTRKSKNRYVTKKCWQHSTRSLFGSIYITFVTFMLSWSEMVSMFHPPGDKFTVPKAPMCLPATPTQRPNKPWKPRNPTWETIFRIPIVCAAYIV